MLPTGAAVAAALALGRSRRAALIVVAAPVAGLLGIALVDLIAGGGAHLTRSVLEAGGLDEAGQVLERRIRLAGQSFQKPTNAPYLVATAIVAAGALWQRRRIAAWFGERTALAGLGGAIAATVIGTVSNDSGAVLLVLGTGYMAAATAFAWARHGQEDPFPRPAIGRQSTPASIAPGSGRACRGRSPIRSRRSTTW